MAIRTSALATLLLAAAAAAGQDPKVPVLVAPDWLAAHVNAPDLVLLHVAMAHEGPPAALIPGARLLDYHAIVEDHDGLPVEMPPVARLARVFAEAGVSNDSRVVLYGEGPPHLAARAFVALDYLGHGERTSVLDGGLEAWRRDGHATTAVPGHGPAGRFVPHPRNGMMVTADWIASHLDDPTTTLVDARPANEYTGERQQQGLRGGHIPGAYNLYFMDLVVSPQQPWLKARAAVERQFAEAGAAPGGTVVNYCYIGMRASYTYLVSRHLGYDAKFYDPSWAEWGRRGELPFVAGAARR